MKVKTLIELLSKCDPESLVITEDGEGNVFDTTNVEINGGEVQIMYGNGDTTYNDDLPEERKIHSYDSEYDSEIAETLRISGIQINEEYNEENIKINDIFVDSEGNEYKVTDIDDTYGEDKYGQPAVYVTFNNRMGMPSTAIKYIFHKKQ